MLSIAKSSLIHIASGFLIVACAPHPNVEVVEHEIVDPRLAAEKIGGSHVRIAQPGDSLHGIAFENGLNPNNLSAWNGLSDTARLQIGQRIRLTQPIGFVARRAPASDKVVANAGDKKTLHKSGSNKGSLIADGSKTSDANTTEGTSDKGPQNIQQSGGKSVVDWYWPTKGEVLKKFSLSSGQQGIDIGGVPGQAVLASGAGEVVYVGNGLKGYGNLVIIKHNHHYLSAYAHNRETFVQEGQLVEARYRIATLGKDKQQRNVLHFQIRKNGEPINPLPILQMNQKIVN